MNGQIRSHLQLRKVPWASTSGWVWKRLGVYACEHESIEVEHFIGDNSGEFVELLLTKCHLFFCLSIFFFSYFFLPFSFPLIHPLLLSYISTLFCLPSHVVSELFCVKHLCSGSFNTVHLYNFDLCWFYNCAHKHLSKATLNPFSRCSKHWKVSVFFTWVLTLRVKRNTQINRGVFSSSFKQLIQREPPEDQSISL